MHTVHLYSGHQHAANQNQQARNKTHIFDSFLQSFGYCTQKEQDKLPIAAKLAHLTHVLTASHSCTQSDSFMYPEHLPQYPDLNLEFSQAELFMCLLHVLSHF